MSPAAAERIAGIVLRVTAFSSSVNEYLPDIGPKRAEFNPDNKNKNHSRAERGGFQKGAPPKRGEGALSLGAGGKGAPVCRIDAWEPELRGLNGDEEFPPQADTREKAI